MVPRDRSRLHGQVRVVHPRVYQQFEAAYVEGKLWFTQVASVKIVRRLKGSAPQPASAEERQLDVRIVDDTAQSLGESPTEHSARLLPLLNSDIISTDAVLPAALRMFCKSPHYTFAVESTVPPIPNSLKGCFLGAVEEPTWELIVAFYDSTTWATT